MSKTPNDPQAQFLNDNNILDIDFDKLYNTFITPIDNLRSHFNNSLNAKISVTSEPQESRCHTFYRMIGFPVVSDDSNFYSPGFDPNLNTDVASTKTYNSIAATISKNQNLIKQFNYREQIPIDYNTIFSNGGTQAQVVMLGSLFIRNFDKQLSNPATLPLIDDPNKIQSITERFSEIVKIFGSDAESAFEGNLISKHPLKPFTVNPAIESSVKPLKNRICAPFLLDKSQTKIFQSQEGSSDSLKRPFIEKVISVRFNNANVVESSSYINKLLADASVNGNIKDPKIIAILGNPIKQLHDSELVIFDKYFLILKALCKQLDKSIKKVQRIRQEINFQPIPSPKNGVEGGVAGGAVLQQVNSIDPQNANTNVELQIFNLTILQALNDVDFDAGIQGSADPGDFAFSDLDDLVGIAHKNIETSYADLLKQLTDIRAGKGNEAIDHLRVIEIIMGEFSGIGLIDIVAIQAALWIMDPDGLLGLIDNRAFARLQLRKNINLNGASRNTVTGSLKIFEAALNNVYSLVQNYFDSINNGLDTSV